jgi:hypothetical protein
MQALSQFQFESNNKLPRSTELLGSLLAGWKGIVKTGQMAIIYNPRVMG